MKNNDHLRSRPLMTKQEVLERDVLESISRSAGPIGASIVHAQLEARGHTISEPTVGRLLRSLDRRLFAERVSNRGRQLTSNGQRRLKELRAVHQRTQAEEHLLSTMRTASLDDLIDVLVARRAIERETARLAAQHATEAHIVEMEGSIALFRKLRRENRPTTEQDVHFHQLIAVASGNRVLAAALKLIRQDVGVLARLKALTQRSELEPGHHHLEVVDAIRRRSADDAERAMVGHMNHLIGLVELAKRRRERPPRPR